MKHVSQGDAIIRTVSLVHYMTHISGLAVYTLENQSFRLIGILQIKIISENTTIENHVHAVKN